MGIEVMTYLGEDIWVREMVNEGLLARNIFTEFGELRAIIRLPWRRIHSLLEEQL